jgi:hypothetical protein
MTTTTAYASWSAERDPKGGPILTSAPPPQAKAPERTIAADQFLQSPFPRPPPSPSPPRLFVGPLGRMGEPFLTPSPSAPNRIQQNLTEAKRIQQDPTESNRIQQNPHESNRIHQKPRDTNRIQENPTDSHRICRNPRETNIIHQQNP